MSKASDHYALGVISYELFAGEQTFSIGYMLDHKQKKDFRPIGQSNPALPDPAQRFCPAKELADALDVAAGASERKES